MVRRLSRGSLMLVAALAIGASGANAFDAERYPDWGGGWYRIGSGNWDPDKPRGLGQEAPLTPEYQAILEASIAAQDSGSQGNNAGYRCIPHGMPRLMLANLPIQFVIMPETTYVIRTVQPGPAHLHRRARLARAAHARLARLFHRQMARCGRRRPLRHSGCRGPRPEKSPRLRQHRQTIC